MALALEFTQKWLRDKFGWKVTQCGVQFEAMPPLENTDYFYVAIDDAGVEQSAPDETDSIKEILSLTIGIWIRPEHLDGNRRGDLKLPNDRYITNTKTLNALERQVVIHQSDTAGVTLNSRDGLHQNWSFLAALNQNYSLPSSLGAKFTQPLRYKGRGKMEAIGSTGQTDMPETPVWFGYRYRFRGLHREQKIRTLTGATDTNAIG